LCCGCGCICVGLLPCRFRRELCEQFFLPLGRSDPLPRRANFGIIIQRGVSGRLLHLCEPCGEQNLAIALGENGDLSVLHLPSRVRRGLAESTSLGCCLRHCSVGLSHVRTRWETLRRSFGTFATVHWRACRSARSFAALAVAACST